jgi:hypothetical protein
LTFEVRPGALESSARPAQPTFRVVVYFLAGRLFAHATQELGCVMADARLLTQAGDLVNDYSHAHEARNHER